MYNIDILVFEIFISREKWRQTYALYKKYFLVLPWMEPTAAEAPAPASSTPGYSWAAGSAAKRGLHSQTPWVQTRALSLTSCVTLDKLSFWASVSSSIKQSNNICYPLDLEWSPKAPVLKACPACPAIGSRWDLRRWGLRWSKVTGGEPLKGTLGPRLLPLSASLMPSKQFPLPRAPCQTAKGPWIETIGPHKPLLLFYFVIAIER